MLTKINKKRVIVLREMSSYGNTELLPMTTLKLAKELGRSHTLIKREMKALFIDYRDKRPYYSANYDLPVKVYKFTLKGLQRMLDFYMQNIGVSALERFDEERMSVNHDLSVYYEDVKAEKTVSTLLKRISKLKRPGDKKKTLDDFVADYLEKNSLDFDKIINHLMTKGKAIE